MKLTNQLIISLLILTNRDLLSFSNIYSCKLKNIKKCFTIEIAESCARDVGPSKYYAMALLQSLKVSYTNSNCIEEEEPRRGIEQNNGNEQTKKVNNKKYSIYNTNGQWLKNIDNEEIFFQSDFPIGIYILKITDKSGNYIAKKVIKL